MSSSSTTRSPGLRFLGVLIILTLSLAFVGALAIFNGDASNATSAFASPGDVLIAGGDIGAEVFGGIPQALFVSSTKSTQIYQASSNTFVAASAMADDREGASGTALPDGTILVAGGYHCKTTSSQVSCVAVNTAEIFDPVAGSFSSVGPMNSARFGQSATLISCGGCSLDGDVLIAGGDDGSITVTETGGFDESGEQAVNTAEVYDYRTKTFTALSNNMTSAREAQAAVIIPNGGGKIALIGGDDKGFFIESLDTAEFFDPANSTFTATAGNMATAREIAPAVALDPSIVTGSLAGQILICGGIDAVDSGTLTGTTNDTCELLNPANGGSFSTVSGTMSSPRSGESLTLFRSGALAGQVLIAGGLDATGNGQGTSGLTESTDSTADIFNPTGSSGTLTQTGSLNEARGGHASALLTSGSNAGDVMVAGGERCSGGSEFSPNCYVVSSSSDQKAGGTADAGELFDPDTQMWTALTSAMQPPVNGASGFGVVIPGPSSGGTPTATASASPSAGASASASASSISTTIPTISPTIGLPTGSPTLLPTTTTTMSPTSAPTVAPTSMPTSNPTSSVSATLLIRPARLAFNNRKNTGTVTISNPNSRKQDSPIAITGATMTGNFQASSNCGSTVAPGDSCTVAFTFKPTTFGRTQGTYTITDNSSARNGMSTVNLIGNLALTPLGVTPPRINFGKENMNLASSPQTVTIQNSNQIGVAVTLAMSGPDANDFHISGNCSGTINAGASCTENVTFDPNGARNRRATLIVSYMNRKRAVALIGVGETGGPTPTHTVAPTATATSSSGPTPTMTSAPTPTITITASATAAPTATSSPAPTVGPTATMTAASPTMIAATPTMTASSAPTTTPTPTATFTLPIPTGILSILPSGLATVVAP